MENVSSEKTSSSHVLRTPVWLTVVRGFQVFLSLVILGLAGSLMHDLYLDEFGLAVATSIITWIIIFYAITTEKITAWHQAYHVVAVLSLEAFLVILWLATFAAAAARRATFSVPANLTYCFDDGSLVSSKTCLRKRALLEKRAYLFKSGQAMFSAIAGLGALVWLLFIATFVYTLVMFLRGRKEGRFPMGSVSSGTHTSTSQDASVMMTQQQQQPPPQQKQEHHHQQPEHHHQQPVQAQPIQPQQTGDHSSTPMTQQPPHGYQPVQSPYQQQSAYQPPQNHPGHLVYQNQYAESPDQQYPSGSTAGFQHHVYPAGSELSGTPSPHPHHSSPPPTSPSSPPTQQYYPQELGNSPQQI
ncbi:hypothetical protein E4U21_003090 [Claviceps maximensis]|nr:hypothetical protein E4U21_003090 [Claviceps maximensis]